VASAASVENGETRFARLGLRIERATSEFRFGKSRDIPRHRVTVAIVLGSWAGARSVLSPLVLGALWTMDQGPGTDQHQKTRTRDRGLERYQWVTSIDPSPLRNVSAAPPEPNWPATR